MGSAVSTNNKLLTPEQLELLERVKESFQKIDATRKVNICEQIEGVIHNAMLKHLTTSLKVTIIGASQVPVADFFSHSDPFVNVQLGEQIVKTKVYDGTKNPHWNESFTFNNVHIGDVLKLELWDKDLFKDDLVGRASCSLLAEGLFSMQQVLSGNKGILKFSYFVHPFEVPDIQQMNYEQVCEVLSTIVEQLTEKSAEVGKETLKTITNILEDKWIIEEKKTELQAVVRREIRSMPVEEQERFLEALKKMMENKDGPETSEYFRLAGYHGWPEDFCAHRQECFPVWHRAYLVAFERALQKADRLNGHDGNISLPYWDFGVYEVNGEVVPKILRKLKNLPDAFFKPDREHRLGKHGYKVLEDKDVKLKLEKARAKELLAACLEENSHWRHASTESRSGTSIENPHNIAHMSLGFPLTSLAFAAFHPAFFLLHCNVDRYYEAYLRLEPDSLSEFKEHQEMRTEKGESNKFVEPLHPFKDHRVEEDEKAIFCPEDMMCEIDTLMYTYETLPKRRPPQMQEPPLWVIFDQVDVVRKMVDRDGNMMGLRFHVFLYDKSLLEVEQGLDIKMDELTFDQINTNKLKYAGWAAGLAGKGSKCKNCKDTKPVNFFLNVTEEVKALKLRRKQIGIKVICADELGKLVLFEDLQKEYGENVDIPEPKLVGPFFESTEAPISINTADDIDDQTEKLQIYLTRYGFYKGPIDGKFTKELETAVKSYQNFVGIAEDGVAGPETKRSMLHPRNDHHTDDVSDQDVAHFKDKKVVKWWLGAAPGYLNKTMVLQEVFLAIDSWASVLTDVLTFERVMKRDEADITITWADRDDDNLFKFDGKGGAIAHASNEGIELDCNERWQISSKEMTRQDEFCLFPVLIHEFGHVLGLIGHSKNPISCMSPFYSRNRIELDQEDISRIQVLYSKTS